MKIPKLLPVLAFPLLTLLSCHKSGGSEGVVSVNIVDAIAQGHAIVPVFGTGPIQYFSIAQTISYGSAQTYSPYSGSNPLYIASITDTTHRIFTGSLGLGAGNIYSFFLAGDTSRPDTLFVRDNIPVYNDSAAGIRVANLSPDSNPIDLNIKGNIPTQTEFINLGYKQISAFKKYAANSSVTGSRYIFEIRNHANDSLLLTYTWSYALYKNNTLVLSGSAAKGSATPLKIFLVKNY